LWGLGQRIFYLQRRPFAATCSAAIEAHEATAAKATTVEAILDQNLSPSQQQDILKLPAVALIIATALPGEDTEAASPGFFFHS